MKKGSSLKEPFDNVLKKSERNRLFLKLTKHVARKLNQIKGSKELTDYEIAIDTGIPQNRISEIRNYQKYNRVLNESTLARLLKGKIVTTKELVENCKLTDGEIDYVNKFVIHERPQLVKEIIMAVKRFESGETQNSPENILIAFRNGELISNRMF